MFGQDLLDLQPLWREYARFAFGDGVTVKSAICGLLYDTVSESTAMPHLAKDWNPKYGLRGHEDVATLLTQDLCGGDVVSYCRNRERRFYNRLPYFESYVNLGVPKNFRAGRVITRLDLIRYWDERGTRFLERYVAFRSQAHFVMARVIR